MELVLMSAMWPCDCRRGYRRGSEIRQMNTAAGRQDPKRLTVGTLEAKLRLEKGTMGNLTWMVK